MNQYQPWSPDEDTLLASIYRTSSWEEMEAALPTRSRNALVNRARRLGLRRGFDAEGIKAEVAGRLERHAPVVLAYLAGVFDGEGCVRLKGSGRSVKVALEISACYLPVLHRFRDTLGGTVATRKGGPGSVKAQFRWHTCNITDALTAIDAMLPYSMEKRDQLALAREVILRKLDVDNRSHPGEEFREWAKSAAIRLRRMKEQEWGQQK